MLWLCIHFHGLPLEIFQPASTAAPDAALAIVERHRICAANASALALGVRPDMSANAALALSDALTLRDREPAHEAATLAGLADWASSCAWLHRVENCDRASTMWASTSRGTPQSEDTSPTHKRAG